MKVGIVGWRGMVGSVLLQRMQEEKDFDGIEPVFFSTSQAGLDAPMGAGKLEDASNIDALKKLDTIITCQGGDYTKAVYPELRKSGWKGYWIDAASALRMVTRQDFSWEPQVWYRMKLRVDIEDDRAVIRGKVWRRDDPEPEAWQITAEDPLPIHQGSPGLYGYSPTPIYFDNINVENNE